MTYRSEINIYQCSNASRIILPFCTKINTPIIILQISATSMTKFSKIYLKNKKESHISVPLKYSFLRSIFMEHMSVKSAAEKWKIHYSSAKIIARAAKKTQLYEVIQQESYKPKPTKQAGWKQIDDDIKIKAQPISEKQSEMGKDGDSFTNSQSYSANKISICSTVGWTFLENRS